MSLLSLITLLFQCHLTSVSVSEGQATTFPNEYIHIDSLEHLKIRTSHWAKVEVQFDTAGTYVLSGGQPNMQRISFFDEHQNLIATGNYININIASRQGKTYYLYYPFVDEKDKNLLSIDVYREVDFLHYRNKLRTNQLIYQSVLSFPVFVAIFFYFFNKQRVYIYYALYILATMFFFGYQYGLVGNVLAFFNDIPPIWVWFFGFTITLFYLLFSVEFLDLRQHDRFSYFLIKIAIAFILFFFLVSVSLYLLHIDVQHSLAYKLPFLSIEFALIIWFILRIFKHPYRIKVYYLSGFFLLFIITMSGQWLSANQSASDYNYIFQSGLVLEVFILALGLGARVNQIQEAEMQAQLELIHQLQLNEDMQKMYTDELERKVLERTQSLSKRNDENEMLLKEVHHRVKNNLQMITSMLNMQQRRSSSEELQTVLVSTRNKIKSMAMIHEHLYSHEDFNKVALKSYIDQLTNMIISSLHKGSQIEVETKIDDLSADIQTTIPIGLIINELITNSLKYGLKDQVSPKLSISLSEKDAALHLTIYDNGPGSNVESEGLGYTIIKSILTTMNGSLTRSVTPKGYTIAIVLKEYQLIRES